MLKNHGKLFHQKMFIFFQGNPFKVQAGSLTFSVMLYTICAFLGITLLMVRRFTSACGNAELGGPVPTKWVK